MRGDAGRGAGSQHSWKAWDTGPSPTEAGVCKGMHGGGWHCHLEMLYRAPKCILAERKGWRGTEATAAKQRTDMTGVTCRLPPHLNDLAVGVGPYKQVARGQHKHKGVVEVLGVLDKGLGELEHGGGHGGLGGVPQLVEGVANIVLLDWAHWGGGVRHDDDGAVGQAASGGEKCAEGAGSGGRVGADCAAAAGAGGAVPVHAGW